MPELYVGLMSGTSMDGIDAVLVDLAGTQPAVLSAANIPWSPTLRERLHSAANGTYMTADQFAQLDAETGVAFAEAAQRIIGEYPAESILGIGSHGQTLAHAPTAQPGYSLQIGAPARISELTRITTVADFRSRDIAAGGQGAPLVPAFHQAILQDAREARVVLNIGGIANITHLPTDAAEAVTGFDTGPGNCLMDAWSRQHLGTPYDENGAFAASGKVCAALLERLLDEPYFRRPAPKSTGTDYFSLKWLQSLLPGDELPPADVQATLLALTATSISAAILKHAPTTQRVLVCGGGSHNSALLQLLRDELVCPVESTANYGIQPDWVEAVAFAWLARQTLNGKPANLPAVTGASGPRILGAIYPA